MREPRQHDPLDHIEIDVPAATRIGDFWHYEDGTVLPVINGGADEPAGGDAGGDAGGITPEGKTTPEGGDTQPAPEGDQAAEAEASVEIPALPEAIDATDEAELRDLHGQLQTLREERRPNAATPADVAVLQDIHERQAAIVAELSRRNEERQRVASELSDLDEGALELPESVPALASAAQVVAAREAQSESAQIPPPPRPDRPRVAMLAAAGTNVASAGEEMTLEQLGRAIDASKRGKHGQVILAALPTFDEMGADNLPDALSSQNGAPRNDQLIAEAVEDWRARRAGEQPARTAATCDPLDTIRDIPSVFTAAEPVRGIFPSRPAGRLGFQFTPSITLDEVDDGSTIWDETEQAAVDPDTPATWKPCVDVVCPDPQDIRAEAATGCLAFDITTEMSSPERIANATSALMAAKARNKEGRVLQRVDTLSHAYQFTGDEIGSLPTLIEAVNSIVAQAVFANRLEDPNYVLLVPPGLVQNLTIDRASRAHGPACGEGDIVACLQAELDGVSQVVRTLDASLGGEPGLPFPALNPVGTAPVNVPHISGGDYRVRLVDPAAAIYAETGELNVGVTRSPELLRQNRAQYFTEEFFMLAKHGPQPWFTVEVVLCADGSRSGLIEPDHCATS